MEKSLLTPDGTPISRFCFGAMQFGSGADAAASRTLYDACRAAGINFFDTAHMYSEGRSESLLGGFAERERDKVFIASKASSPFGLDRKGISRSVEESRSRLGLDRIDLYYLHHWSEEVALDETFGALAEEVEAGRIGRIGVSNFAAWQVMKAERAADAAGLRIDMLQPMYNLVKRQAEVEILPMAQSEGFAVAPYSPLGGGLLSGKYSAGGTGRLNELQMYARRYAHEWMHRAAADLATLAGEVGMHPATLAVAWVARHPGITAPIISARSVAQLQPSLDALDLVLDESLYARLSALTPTPPPATDRLEES